MRALVGLAVLLVGGVALSGCGTTKTKTVVVRETHTVTTVRTVTRTETDTATVTTTKTIAPQPTVYVATRDGVQYKPSQMNYYGGQNYIAHIRWKSYGGDVAVGTADWGYNTCDKGCAEGPYTYTPITIRLMTRVNCKGVVAYQDWSLVGAKLDPTPQNIAGDGMSPC
jgi:hypothetical protein